MSVGKCSGENEARKRERILGWTCTFKQGGQGGLSDKVTIEQRPEGGDVGTSWTWVGRENIPG